MKKTTLLSLFLITFHLSFGQTILTEGDLAITGIISDSADEFSFVLLTDILSGTEINFTDKGCGLNGGFVLTGSGNNTAEGIITWTTATDLPCGTEIVIKFVATNTFSANIGTAIESENGFAITAGSPIPGDQLIAFQGSIVNPTFLYAVHFGNANGWTNATDYYNSAVPAGLTEGINAINLGNFKNNKYNCTTTSNKQQILETLADVNATNWSQTQTSRPVLGSCTYTCSPVENCISITRWDGTNWDNGTPNLTTAAIISGNYSTNLGSIKCCSLTIDSGATLTIENYTFIEIQNNVTVNGSLIVETQGNFVQNNKNGIFTLNPSGTSQLNKETPIKSEWYHYTFWSTPVNGEIIDHAFPNVDDDRSYRYNTANLIDTNNDDIDDNGDDWESVDGNHIMEPGVGYACMSSRALTYPNTHKVTFEGPFNTGNISTNIIKNASNPGISWNFIGNPYPSAIDFIAFQQANGTLIDGAAYIWSHASPPDPANPGHQQSNFNQNDYSTFTVGSGGAAGASGVIPNKYIASGQSFFVPALKNGNATFTNAMRMADETSNSQFLKNTTKKKSSSALENKLWINLSTNNGVFSQILVAYVEGATNEDDGLSYDATRIINEDYNAFLYTSMASNTNKYVIQGKGINNIHKNEIIKLGFNTQIDAPLIYTLEIDHFEGDFISKNNVYLKDNLLNVIHNLSNSNYTFTSEIGEFKARFEIVFQNNRLTQNTNTLDSNVLKIVHLKDNDVQFNVSKNLKIETIKIYDLFGRQLYNLKGHSNSETYNLPRLSNIYIAKIKLSNGDLIIKKGIRKRTTH
ncbi:hypothetical protein [Tamlana sp. I1]|uniref:hypothetical protein n=1 Tax=Tamlana sp. I1 TaxID=2762061 RepID=UPI00188F4426|nr:hypothetical protein [Tamlana sp. I1]